jgi:hypothetical protein
MFHAQGTDVSTGHTLQDQRMDVMGGGRIKEEFDMIPHFIHVRFRRLRFREVSVA